MFQLKASMNIQICQHYHFVHSSIYFYLFILIIFWNSLHTANTNQNILIFLYINAWAKYQLIHTFLKSITIDT